MLICRLKMNIFSQCSRSKSKIMVRPGAGVKTSITAPGSTTLITGSEPEFLNTLKCNLAESASTGYQFNCYVIFNDKNLIKRI
jgi:hypothetical protein